MESNVTESNSTESETASSIPFSSFTDYKQIEINLINDLEQLRRFSEKLTLNKSVEAIDDVLERIKTKTFWVAVVGEFKRGKSTFVNALLKQEILPADVDPCSATVNRVTYSPTSFVEIEFKPEAGGHRERIAVDQLARYVTQLTPEAKAIAATIKEAIVYHPIEYCKNNVDIIDTPGLNDDPSMTEVTLSILPKVDAAILVIMAQAPVSEVERDFLENTLLTNDLGRVIFVVTGIDRCNRPEDVDKVINTVTSRIQEHVLHRAETQWGKDSPEYEVYLKKIGDPKVFGISAYQALEAERTNDPDLLAHSRFSEFRQALEEFLVKERGAIELQVPINRAIASAAEILKTLNIQEKALEMQQEEFNRVYDSSVAEISELRSRKRKEMQLIDQAADNVRSSVRPKLNQLDQDLKQAAERIIDSIPIAPADLRNKKALTEKLSRKVSSGLQSAAQKLTEAILTTIQEGLEKEIDRLKEFAGSVDDVLTRIETNFIGMNIDTNRKRSGEVVVAAIAAFTGLGGVWSGFRMGGAKGAAVGAVGSFATAFTAGILLSILSLPISLPAILAISVVSIFTGGKLVQMVFPGDVVDGFRANFKEAAIAEIDKQLKSNPVNQKVEDFISETFSTLKQTLNQEVESLLDNTQNTLTDLSRKRARNEALTENEHKELEEMRAKTEKILGSAERRSRELVKILSV